MPYDPSVPKMGDSASQDYQQMQQNYVIIGNSFAVDHDPLTDSLPPSGFHLKSTYKSGSDPAAVAGAGIAYSKVNSTHSELFYRGEAGTGSIQQITNQLLVASMGQGMLPGGLQIRTGVGNSGPSTSVTVSFLAFPTATISAFCVAGGVDVAQSCQPSAVTNSTFVVTMSKTFLGFYWLAIGY